MGYDGNIREKLNYIEIDKESKIFPDVVKYKLAYSKTNHKSFDNKEIVNYINENYLNKDAIIEENLLNDLITFKTFKFDKEYRIRCLYIFQNELAIILSLMVAIMSFSATCLSSENIFKYIIPEWINKWVVTNMPGILIIVLVFYLTIAFFRVVKNSTLLDLRFINNAIYTLETIKEDMDKDENSRDKYKATKNKYSPRAMYEKKDVKKN
ncbi:MAG: hypothetical protein E7H98_06855 [Finegoldia magna]|uniref:hypothetical protein n=1 Tax=Finegoldia magna TaxID=1260 RepID=UPI0026E9B755|nr:hypothetical protein [Finegoldia magna]MBS5966784.1 hypothetical protein [Finegoldia magna]MDU4209631.1 hypothetical protein [Finegoldia magna]